ncbi:MAG: 4Fe-4S dicluster domain-containing protein [archaeon YNP-WB-040]|nr:4Fe-4S dicluster domain-containing protein [Candidatus Culexarchaeum yellowstonense]
MNLEEQKVLFYDPNKCSGCLYCMEVCSYKHYGVIDISKAYLMVALNPEGNPLFINNYCSHCQDPFCMAACPVEPKAISKDPVTGFVLINSALCIGCRSCNYACPISIPFFDDKLRVSVKCDACKGEFLCAKYCSTGALQVLPRREVLERVRS